MKIFVVTSNLHKFRELQFMLQNVDLEKVNTIVNEDGKNYKDNVLKKAQSFDTNEWVLADDSGLEISSLGNYPGVYSARVLGLNYDTKIKYLLELLKDKKSRDATFRTVLALCKKKVCYTFEGVLQGKIGYEKKGRYGFGYDPIFYLKNGKSLSELTLEEKSKICHRGQAVVKLKNFLKLV